MEFTRLISDKLVLSTHQDYKPKQLSEISWFESAYSNSSWSDTVFHGVADEARVGRYDYRATKAAKIPVILVVNKIDKVHPDQFCLDWWLVIKWTLRKLFQISLQGNNVSRLVDILRKIWMKVWPFPVWSNHRPSRTFLGFRNGSRESLAPNSWRDSAFCSSSCWL